MTDQELLPLHHAADGELLFHTGRWGCPAGYRWRGPYGEEAGQVPVEENEQLERLRDLGFIAIEDRPGPTPRKVMVTAQGLTALHAAA